MLYDLLKPLIWQINPETAHNFVINLLKTNLLNIIKSKNPNPILKTNLANMVLPSPLGLAAGFDKNFEVFDKMFNLGFGFVESGTVTPQPQLGNAKPRIFRLIEDEALINRLGFNNDGLVKIKENILDKFDRFALNKLGANIGPNKNSKNRIEDYIICYKSLAKISDYITINISSPNTPGLRNFETSEIDELLTEINKSRINENSIFVKLSPDISNKDLEISLQKIVQYGMNGVILTNTTLARPNFIKSNFLSEKGGLSGKPLLDRSKECISIAYKLIGRDIPIIGVGGISCLDDVLSYLNAGASAVQLYTGLIYKGPKIASNINDELAKYLISNKISNISELVGINH
tara:strand:+ start:17767 stop:18810 length:1044 start_codon:yes stop_codon:yes gene_type:complete